MSRNTVVGVDVGGSKKGFHAVAISDNKVTGKLTSSSPTEVGNWCVHMNARVVAVDAPSQWSKDGRAREAERKLMAQKIWCFSTPTKEAAIKHLKNHFGWMRTGQDLYDQLKPNYYLFDGTWRPHMQFCVETFPHAIVCALRGEVTSARNKGKVRREVLRVAGIDTVELSNIDFVDAALCAVAATCFLKNQFKSYGSDVDGYIVVPPCRGL